MGKIKAKENSQNSQEDHTDIGIQKSHKTTRLEMIIY